MLFDDQVWYEGTVLSVTTENSKCSIHVQYVGDGTEEDIDFPNQEVMLEADYHAMVDNNTSQKDEGKHDAFNNQPH